MIIDFLGFEDGIELMNEDQSLIEVIRAGNDNLFQSKVFAETLSSIIGKNIQTKLPNLNDAKKIMELSLQIIKSMNMKKVITI